MSLFYFFSWKSNLKLFFNQSVVKDIFDAFYKTFLITYSVNADRSPVDAMVLVSPITKVLTYSLTVSAYAKVTSTVIQTEHTCFFTF